jgi:hypothetical protein
VALVPGDMAALLQFILPMTKARSNSPRPVLNWILRRGPRTLMFEIRRTGARYQVAILPGDGSRRVATKKRLHAKLFRAGRKALQLHATLVAGFREAGWTPVASR